MSEPPRKEAGEERRKVGVTRAASGSDSDGPPPPFAANSAFTASTNSAGTATSPLLGHPPFHSTPSTDSSQAYRFRFRSARRRQRALRVRPLASTAKSAPWPMIGVKRGKATNRRGILLGPGCLEPAPSGYLRRVGEGLLCLLLRCLPVSPVCLSAQGWQGKGWLNQVSLNTGQLCVVYRLAAFQ